MRKANARKPYLNKKKKKHVRRYYPKKVYSNKLTCFACNEEGHLEIQCLKRKKKLYSKNAILTECTNVDPR